MSFQCIGSFQDVVIKPNSLVICDIDDTLIKSKENLNYFYQKVKLDFPYYNHELLLKEAWDMQQVYNQIYGFVHTDLEGFDKLHERVQSNAQSQLIFLTARSQLAEDFTRKNFEFVGLNYDDFHVYYTDNIKIKGQYILDHIDLNGFEHVVFIDDNDFQINSVLNLIGEQRNVSCYKFEIPGYKDIDVQYEQDSELQII